MLLRALFRQPLFLASHLTPWYFSCFPSDLCLFNCESSTRQEFALAEGHPSLPPGQIPELLVYFFLFNLLAAFGTTGLSPLIICFLSGLSWGPLAISTIFVRSPSLPATSLTYLSQMSLKALPLVSSLPGSINKKNFWELPAFCSEITSLQLTDCMLIFPKG